MRGAKERRVIVVATKQDRALATGELDRPPFLPDHAIAWSPDGKWIAFLNGGQGAFQNPHVVALAGGPGRGRSAFCPTPTAVPSPGAPTARTSCSTHRSARRTANSSASI